MKVATDDHFFRLDGRVALLTGAGRGIGLAMAKELAAAGCAVAIQDIDLAVAELEANRINQSGGRAIALGGDLTDVALPGHLVNEVIAQLGGFHILVNNGSIQQTLHWLKVPVERMELEMRANLITPIRLCQLAVPIFRKQQWGRIINLGSIQQRSGNVNMFPYSLCKAAMEKLTMALARDLASEHITVNLIAPGWIDTYRNREAYVVPERKIELGQKWIPMGRIGEPDDFRSIILFMCSEASSYMTGQSIYVDGGLSAQ